MPQTLFPYRVIYDDKSTRLNYDFVKESGRYYYYQPEFDIDQELYQGLLDTYDRWRGQALAGVADFDWNQFCKLPYLKQSLSKEKKLRWPIMFRDQDICCGGGRCVVIKIFDIPVITDRIICSTKPLQGLIVLDSVADIESILMQKEYWRLHMKSSRWWNFKIYDGAIFAHDVSTTNNTFPFVMNSGRNKTLLPKVQNLVLHSTLGVESLLHAISELSVTRISKD